MVDTLQPGNHDDVRLPEGVRLVRYERPAD